MSSESLRMAVKEAQRYLEELPSPPNEANTCDWVIRPLLLALGYQNHEIHAQAGDVANKFPDYTVLPNSPHTWFLEAKAWTVTLDSSHVDQALNYAHANGQRWVVLSNGREWRLYDDRIVGKSADRLVATALLQDTEKIERFLTAITRSSIQGKAIEIYAGELKVRDYLLDAISNTGSPVIQAVLKVVRQKIGGANFSAETIVDILNARQAGQVVEIPAQSQCVDDSVSEQRCFEPLFIKRNGLVARGRYLNKVFTIFKGSQVAKHPVPSYTKMFQKKVPPLVAAGKLADRVDHYELLEDLDFGSPSGASDLVYGRSTNGWVVWVDHEGVVLDQLWKRSRQEQWRKDWKPKE